MTETELRLKMVGIMESWLGKNESDGSFKKIIDIYNEQKNLPRKYKVKYTDEWCATTISACAIEAGLADIIPCECSCYEQVKLLQKKGSWKEDDYYIPKIADIIYYDWQDNGKGDNKGVPDHVGLVEKIEGRTITVIEGNNNCRVARRNILVNGKYIRGYGIPNYASKASKTETKNENKKVLKAQGSKVTFDGKWQYTSAYADGKKVPARKCSAEITAIKLGKQHEYHLIGNGVYGWVNKSDIVEFNNDKDIAVGDTVEFLGTTHYENSYAGAKGYKCKSGTAKVTAINRNGKYVYHLKHTGKESNVDGWVEAKYVKSK